jgi:hypothetical protein
MGPSAGIRRLESATCASPSLPSSASALGFPPPGGVCPTFSSSTASTATWPSSAGGGTPPLPPPRGHRRALSPFRALGRGQAAGPRSATPDGNGFQLPRSRVCPCEPSPRRAWGPSSRARRPRPPAGPQPEPSRATSPCSGALTKLRARSPSLTCARCPTAWRPTSPSTSAPPRPPRTSTGPQLESARHLRAGGPGGAAGRCALLPGAARALLGAPVGKRRSVGSPGPAGWAARRENAGGGRGVRPGDNRPLRNPAPGGLARPARRPTQSPTPDPAAPPPPPQLPPPPAPAPTTDPPPPPPPSTPPAPLRPPPSASPPAGGPRSPGWPGPSAASSTRSAERIGRSWPAAAGMSERAHLAACSLRAWGCRPKRFLAPWFASRQGLRRIRGAGRLAPRWPPTSAYFDQAHMIREFRGRCFGCTRARPVALVRPRPGGEGLIPSRTPDERQRRPPSTCPATRRSSVLTGAGISWRPGAADLSRAGRGVGVDRRPGGTPRGRGGGLRSRPRLSVVRRGRPPRDRARSPQPRPHWRGPTPSATDAPGASASPVITQNDDGLPPSLPSGSARVVELHGTLRRSRCATAAPSPATRTATRRGSCSARTARRAAPRLRHGGRRCCSTSLSPSDAEWECKQALRGCDLFLGRFRHHPAPSRPPPTSCAPPSTRGAAPSYVKHWNP